MTVQDLIARAEALGITGRDLERLFMNTLGHVGFRSIDDEAKFVAALDRMERPRSRWRTLKDQPCN